MFLTSVCECFVGTVRFVKLMEYEWVWTYDVCYEKKINRLYYAATEDKPVNSSLRQQNIQFLIHTVQRVSQVTKGLAPMGYSFVYILEISFSHRRNNN